MTHHDSTDPTDHDDVLYKTQGNPVPDAHDEERREAPAGGDYTASESEEEKEAREGGA
ncbi:hypothetical protein [Clavibacter michiganensis]|jgi:hypothetical protein|uniref:Uncharacterized protein n=1 Tax=Clavibacter michiganensis TaxID=28447 RepID=A0A251Y7C5_9MICO|nr:hypothetical protein [Clavibacter michiganensis]AWF97188.1 hypothetical protein BEH61_01575 [Clavibacter michiganensis subsp. insidiosus]AWG02725.1 hypothetical protein BEH62_14100 [Clavibacter michiganensis subsp. insidiosus]MBM7412016.1 hypothetical protein [Clavibacter michiganensis]OUE19913.1 hypothetical protein BFL34_02059 [Clavibacter michiganensis]